MLERLKPLDAKLQYQIGRLLRSGAYVLRVHKSHCGHVTLLCLCTPHAGFCDGRVPWAAVLGAGCMPHARCRRPLVRQNDTSRPNASSLVPHGAEDGEDEQDGADNEAQRVYQPLKRTSVAFETRSSKEERRAARRLKRASKSKMLAELKEEMSEAPKEIRDRTSASAAADRREVRNGHATQRRHLRCRQSGVHERCARLWMCVACCGCLHQEEQRRFEEEHMVRLVVSKKERKLRRQQRREAQRLSTLADLDGEWLWWSCGCVVLCVGARNACTAAFACGMWLVTL